MSTSPASDDVVRSMNWLRVWLSLPVPMRSASAARHSSIVSNSPRFSLTHSSVSSGSTVSWTLVTLTTKSAGSLVPLGVAVKRQFVADVGAEQLAVEAGGHPAAADLVQPVLGVEPGDGLAVAGAGEVEGDLVAGLHRAIDVDQRTLPAQLGFDGLVDVGLGGHGRRSARRAARRSRAR